MARGHVRQRPNGRWAAVIELPRDRDGKRRQQWITCDSKSEAERCSQSANTRPAAHVRHAGPARRDTDRGGLPAAGPCLT